MKKVLYIIAAVSLLTGSIAFGKEVQTLKGKKCGTISITNKEFPAGITGELTVLYIDNNENFVSILLTPEKKAHLLKVDPNPMAKDALWEKIETCMEFKHH